MQIKEIKNEFNDMYTLMKLSFPSSEFRTYEGQKELLKDDKYKIFIIKNDEDTRVIGLACVWDFDTFLYIEHLAVHPDFRNHKLGSLLLDYLKDYFTKPICLEVEEPDDELKKRRVGFYKRNGFNIHTHYDYTQPKMREDGEELPLKIMATEVFDEKHLDKIKHTLYKYVYKVK